MQWENGFYGFTDENGFWGGFFAFSFRKKIRFHP
jgi:hypothetical protein